MNFITDILGDIDIKEFVVHYSRSLRILWNVSKPGEDLTRWVYKFHDEILFPEIEIIPSNSIENKLKKYILQNVPVFMKYELENRVKDEHGDREPDTFPKSISDDLIYEDESDLGKIVNEKMKPIYEKYFGDKIWKDFEWEPNE